jgi:hypothetical protein
VDPYLARNPLEANHETAEQLINNCSKAVPNTDSYAVHLNDIADEVMFWQEEVFWY